jgi:lipid-A-disaccharide synthase
LGGAALAGAGAEVIFDARRLGSMGIGAAVRKGRAAVQAFAAVTRAAGARRPRAALLVGFSEFNGVLAPHLRARGTRVAWYAPPQVWAWRPGRATRLATSADVLAVLLPFERARWNEAGGTAVYVGHPAVDRREFRMKKGPGPEGTRRLALIPGSRAEEVRAHLPVLLEAAARLRNDLRAEVVKSPFLDARTSLWVDERARAAAVKVVDGPVQHAVTGAEVAITASGTATLECAAAGVPPVIVYRTGALSYALAKRLVRVPHVGLPNLVLGRRAFPELVQGEFTAEAVASRVRSILQQPARYSAACRETLETLSAGLDARTSAERVAALLAPWLN